jgi:transposase
MSCRVNVINKRTGVTYVYESNSYWDKEKQQPRNKRTCIGKLDPETGAFIPSKRLKPAQLATSDPVVTASTEIIGPSVILNSVTEKFGLDKLLKSCFPDTWQQILTMAHYLVVDGRALSRCEVWCKSHAPLMAQSLASQRISEILGAITFDAKQTFLSQWMRSILEQDYLCYDITSISSYSESNEYIKYGHNRDNEPLGQLNLAVLYGQNGRLPVYYHRLPGNITDVSTLCNLLKSFKKLKMKTLSYVMDKGFYSKKNVDDLFATKNKFLLSVPINNKWLQKAIDDVYESIHGPQGYQKLDDEFLYIHTRLYPWSDKRHRCYLHLYYNARARAEAIDQFNETLCIYKQELESGNLIQNHQKAYDDFFIIKNTPKRGKKVTYNMPAVNRYLKRYTGFQALLTNNIKDPLKALQVYRDKDVVEKCFDDYKNQLDMKRLRMHTSTTVDGRLFVQFIALIYVSALRKQMREADLMKHYTVRELLQETETLVRISYSGTYGHILTELTKPQRDILNALNINTNGLA